MSDETTTNGAAGDDEAWAAAHAHRDRIRQAAADSGVELESLARLVASVAAGCLERNPPVPPKLPTPEQAAEALCRKLEIPESYRWAHRASGHLLARIAHPDPATLLQQVIAARQVVLVGPARAGKTSLAVAALRHVGATAYGARFCHAHRLGTARIQHGAGEGEATIVRRAIAAKLLLLDDVGNERQMATNAVPDVIFERHADDAPTWYTTAFEADAIAAKYGDGIARRMFERALVVRLGGGR